MKFFPFLGMGILGLLPPLACAHEYRMEPVNIELKIESAQVRARITSSADYWIEEIFDLPTASDFPASDWPDTIQALAKSEVSKAFQLSVDGRPLFLEKFACRYVQEPFDSGSAKVVYDLSFPLSAPAERISGRVRFFEKYYGDVMRTGGMHAEDGVFLARLRVIGKKKIVMVIPFEKPDFEFPVSGHEYTAAQQRMERFGALGMRALSNPFVWLFLIALGYQVYNRFVKRVKEE